MSRVDEAIRRMRAGQGELPEVEPQDAFRPAWGVDGSTEAGAAPIDADGEEPASQLDRRPRRPSAAMVSFSSAWRERLASGPHGDPGLVEQFRRLAATLHHAQRNNGIRSVMITSASAGDGKTLTAVNLALVLAESYRYNVLLVDADLRRPSIPSVIDLGEGSGLSDVLRATTEQKLALVSVTPRLTLLPAGSPVSNSIEALTSPRMRQILDEATSRFDWVVLDAPPVGPTVDARLLTQMVGGTLFVIQAGVSQFQDVEKAISAIGRDQILGVVLNGVEGVPSDGYYGSERPLP